MALWPFRRKSGRKRSRSGAALSDAEGPPARSQTGDPTATRAASKKKQRVEPAKLQRRQRAYSFSPGRRDDLGAEHRRTSVERREAAPGGRRERDRQPKEVSWDRTPTLHHNQSGKRPSRRKSSKMQKREERARAAEIKAMSSFEPTRPAAEYWTAGRPMKKDSKRVKSAPNFPGQPAGQPDSEVSLPIPASIQSSMSSDSEFRSFKVSALDSLAPRPTLRYAPGTRWGQSKGTTEGRSASQKKPSAAKESACEEALNKHRRVDDLADGLTAKDLRELMEREDRRQEKKRQREQERAERRLAREAEKQKADQTEARKSGSPAPENLERGVVGRELVGLGIDPPSATVTTSGRRGSGASEKMPDADEANDADSERAPEPLSDSPQQPGPAPHEHPYAIPEIEENGEDVGPEQPKPQDSTTSLAPSSRLAGILRSKKSRSKSTLASERDKAISPSPEVIDEEGAPRNRSWGSEKRGRFSLTSFLRWSGKNRHHSGGPPSFSNTSREEMQGSVTQTPAQALARLQGDDVPRSLEQPAGAYLPRKPSTAAPLRTKSRFREDLPDFPMSPPDSRVQSPEGDPTANSSEPSKPIEGRSQPIAIPRSGRDRSSISPDAQPSISLASIDSEASWLSGRVGRRSSTIRDSIAQANRQEGSRNRRRDSSDDSTREDLAITDDDYMARLAPHGTSSGHHTHRLSSDGRPSSDEEDLPRESGARWGAVGSRPQFVHTHDRNTIQSYQGLLNIESGDESESPVTPSAQEKADIQRARSVNLGKGGHVRNFSAGSAKLLDLSPRDSADGSVSQTERRASGQFA